ncbi:STAS domain-containing protein [Streptomyces glomeratus]|uniref:STAS domain-containing protein n=1 Tax=Streptomyces glomeratus TaxID=284452 RepID=A0ABP6LQV9_9ACTN|nr:STAS domain-containing protein [Streptomyces glomeratus]MCF1510482.1 STAS domain-containing protein [Streptomyces glomeratus]
MPLEYGHTWRSLHERRDVRDGERGRGCGSRPHSYSGINIFIAAHRTLGEADGWLRLAAPRESVMRTLNIVGVDTLIDCRETLHQAISN